LIVAVSFSLEASEAVAELRSSYQLKHWEAYARLHKKVDAILISLFLCYCDKSIIFCLIQ
jgi:hypothetical protein